MSKLIAIDCDSVLFPLNELAVLPVLSDHFNREVRKDEITDWHYTELGREARNLAFEQFRRPDLYDGYRLEKIMPGAAKVLADLREYHRVIAVSSPVEEHACSKWRFLRRCGFSHQDIVLTGDKRLVDFDVLLDDGPTYCLDIGPAHALVFDQPWNRADELQDFVRAYGWDDVPRKLDRLLGQ